MARLPTQPKKQDIKNSSGGKGVGGNGEEGLDKILKTEVVNIRGSS